MRSLMRWAVVSVCFFVASGSVHADGGLTRISDHVYSYVDVKPANPVNSFGANAGIVVGQKAVLVVDTLVSSKKAKRLIQDIGNVTNLPIKYVVNTHYHFDHVLGNGEFEKLEATIISHEMCKKAMEHTGAKTLEDITNYGLTAQDMEGTRPAYPVLSFNDSMHIDLGNLEVTLRHAGPSHTEGSIVVIVPKDKVLFAGDILFTERHPFIGDGDMAGWLKTLDHIMTEDVEKIVPGHGPLSSKCDVADMKAYLLLFDATAKRLTAGSDDFQYIVAEMAKALPAKNGLESLIGANIQMKYMTK